MSEAKMKKPVTNLLLAGALLLPLAGLGYSWATTHRDAQKGTDWDIPVRGYDPRDLLRGHYIQYQYDWPGLAADGANRNGGYYGALCIKGVAPKIDNVTRMRPNEVVRANCDGIVLFDKWSEEYDYTMTRDRLFIPQTKGEALEDKLRDPKLQGVVRARIRDDGKITPQSISFRTNPNPEGVQRDRDQLQVIDIEEVGPDAMPEATQPPRPAPPPPPPPSSVPVR